VSPTFRAILIVCTSISLSSFWWSCAGQVAPGGGPRDETAPVITGVFPEPNSTHVETDVIRFRFNKYVDQQSFRRALFISPLLDDIEIRWRGREVEIRLHEPLLDQTTYSVTIGTDLRDLREGNRLEESFTLAFSTGDVIDEGRIAGRVYYSEPVGVLIFAYQLRDAAMADTLDPREQRPDYITQTGRHGVFNLPFLRFGTYRVLAIQDEFQNRLYDPDVDPYGVYVGDVAVTGEEPVADNIQIRMQKTDRTRPFLSRAWPVHRSKLIVRFSKPVDPASLSTDSFIIVHSDTGDLLGVLNHAVRRRNESEVYLFTEPLRDGSYTLTADTSISDRYGNLLRSDERTAGFAGTTDPPEESVRVEYIHPEPNQQNVRLIAPIVLQFSAPVRTERFEQAIQVRDTSDVAVAGTLHWEDDTTLQFHPDREYESAMQYTVAVNLEAFPSAEGLQGEVESTGTDSLYTSTFTVVNRDRLGAIEGAVLSERDIGYTVRADRVGSDAETDRYRITLEGGGPFTIRNVPDVSYRVWAFEDADMSGAYRYGQVFPFEGSAPFAVFPDTVTVRARWTVDGILLDLRGSDYLEE
jgi:hypothetical protein